MATWREKKLNEIDFGIFASNEELDEIDRIVLEAEKESMNNMKGLDHDSLRTAREEDAKAVDAENEKGEEVPEDPSDKTPKELIEATFGPGSWGTVRAMDKAKRKEIVNKIRTISRLDGKISEIRAACEAKVKEIEDAKVTMQAFVDAAKAKVESVQKTLNS
jgi:hypothetical protein